MEQRLHEILMDGEQVRWTGRPSPFKLMQCPERNTFFVTWLLSGAAVLLALFYLLPALDSTQRGGADWFVMLVVAFVPAMLSLRPLLDKLCLEKNTLYAITDRRVIALVKDDLMYIPLEQKPAVSVEGRDRDCGNLCFGEAVGCGSGNSRSNAVLGIRESSSQNDMLGMLFYHVSHPEQLLRYIA